MSAKTYYKGTSESAGHSPIYKMHRYFARRPHNVFRALIDQYCPDNGVILDCFAGGGVSLIEGLSAGRRVIAYDVNSVASFIQYAQLIEISEARFLDLTKQLQARVQAEFGHLFQTSCRRCHATAHVRWVEHTYNVKCPRCSMHTPLGNGNKHRNETGRAVDGQYDCVHCSEKIKAASAPRISSTMLNLRYRCSDCGEHATAEPLTSDVEKFSYCIQKEDELSASLGLKIPDDAIPVEWDRQQEDCLHRKGFKQFKDFFTPRNRLISALYFAALDELRPRITSDEYLFLLLNLSALLRYTNNMTFCVDGWMDGRPVAWAKHAYWTPNQFIECNPLEYFGNRVKASVSGLKDRRTRFSKSFQHGEPREVLGGSASFSIQNASSESVDLPDNSVDLVLTDPPYGSNVQYGELCHFWAVWLKGRLPFEPKLFDLQQEILVHRKKSSEVVPKTFDDYQQGLNRVFSECFRILKSGGHLVFTFNNKNLKAWFAVIRAALDAGFDIEERGVTYQGEIEAYRDTAHQRHDGTAKGDFIYTFIKGNLDERIASPIRYDQRQLDLSIFEDVEEGEFLNSAAERQMFSLIQAIRNGACENELSHIMGEIEKSEVSLV